MDPLFKVHWIRYALANDLIPIENQITFFILENLHTMIFNNIYRFGVSSIYCHLPHGQNYPKSLIALQSISSLSVEPFISSLIPQKLGR